MSLQPRAQVEHHEQGSTAASSFQAQREDIDQLRRSLKTQEEVAKAVKEREDRLKASATGHGSSTDMKEEPGDGDDDLLFSSFLSSLKRPAPPPAAPVVPGGENIRVRLNAKTPPVQQPAPAPPGSRDVAAEDETQTSSNQPAEAEEAECLAKAADLYATKKKQFGDSSLWDTKMRLRTVKAAAKAIQAEAATWLVSSWHAPNVQRCSLIRLSNF